MIISFLYLLIRLLIIAGVYFGIKWLATWLGVSIPDIIWKIFAAICVLLGAIAILAWGFGAGLSSGPWLH